MSLSSLLILAASLLSSSLAITPGRREETGGVSAVKSTASQKFKDALQVLSIPLRRIERNDRAVTTLQKRYFQTDILGVFGAAYLAEISIGTTGSGDEQVVDVLLDTGSFELWVNPNCSASNVPDFCTSFDQYDPSLSTTSMNLMQNFSIQYGSGSTRGSYYSDDVFISGARIEKQQFGVANQSDLVWFGIMGLGRGRASGFVGYDTVLDSLAVQNVITSRLFSIDLGTQGQPGVAISGEIVFGGVDQNKYSGLLTKLPILPTDAHYTIQLRSISHQAPNSQAPIAVTGSAYPVPVIVDSGTTLSLLPEAIVTSLAAQFPGAEPDGDGGYRVPCAFQQQTGSVNFGFDGVDISVPYSEFIWNAGGTDNCFLGAWYSPDVGVYILGDSFLRAAYVVFDVDNAALFLGQYVACGTASALAPVPAGDGAAGAIPGNCDLVVAPPASSTTTSAASSVTSFPGGTLTSTALPSSLGVTVNPAVPVSLSESSTTSTVTSSSVASPPGVTGTDTGMASSTTPSSVTSATSVTSVTSITSVTSATSVTSITPVPGGIVSSSSPTTTANSTITSSLSVSALDPNVSANSTARISMTSTITSRVVYTITACPVEVTSCPLGQLATTTSIHVTTICPDETASTPAETAAPAETTTAPAETTTAPAGTTTAPAEAATPAMASEPETAPASNPSPTPASVLPAGAAPAPAMPQVTVAAGPVETSTFAVTSCGAAAAAAGCSVGMMSTRTRTRYRTLTVSAEMVATRVPACAGCGPGARRNGTAVVQAAAAPGRGTVQLGRTAVGLAVLVVAWGVR